MCGDGCLFLVAVGTGVGLIVPSSHPSPTLRLPCRVTVRCAFLLWGCFSICACFSWQWYEIQDLRMEETMPQLIGLSESYLMIYRLQE